MENLLSEALASSLQYATFPLELIGVALALIEIRLPKVAAYLTTQIERLSALIQDMRTGQSGSESIMQRSLGP